MRALSLRRTSWACRRRVGGRDVGLGGSRAGGGRCGDAATGPKPAAARLRGLSRSRAARREPAARRACVPQPLPPLRRGLAGRGAGRRPHDRPPRDAGVPVRAGRSRCDPGLSPQHPDGAAAIGAGGASGVVEQGRAQPAQPGRGGAAADLQALERQLGSGVEHVHRAGRRRRGGRGRSPTPPRRRSRRPFPSLASAVQAAAVSAAGDTRSAGANGVFMAMAPVAADCAQSAGRGLDPDQADRVIPLRSPPRCARRAPATPESSQSSGFRSSSAIWGMSKARRPSAVSTRASASRSAGGRSR